MGEVIVPTILGVFCVILGVLNSRGNISSIHWYHRHRITEENILPFGKKIGLGTVIIGVSLIVFGLLSLVSRLTHLDLFTIIGATILIIGIVVGLALSLYAMIKYNKGIF